MAVDSAGNVYVADSRYHTIRKVTAGGEVTTLAGTKGAPGSTEGTGAAARFFGPTGVAVDSTGNVYVADQNNYTIRKVTAAGVVTNLAGFAGMRGSADGMGTAARFDFPSGVAVDSAGNVYVADQFNRAIRKVTAAGAVTTLAPRFSIAAGVAVDSTGNVYVADPGNGTIYKVTAAGVVTMLAGIAGSSGVAVDSAGNVYVADNFDTIRKVTAAGVVTTLAGTAGASGSADGVGSGARFNSPEGVAVDSVGNVYVADKFNNTVRKVTAAGVVTTLAGASDGADGAGALARFKSPEGVAADSAGNIYVADSLNYTIRKVTPAGVVTTLAGTAGAPGSADDAGAAARFYQPIGVAVDSTGNVYVADSSAHTIRKITPAGGVTTLAGTAGISGSADDIGAAARFNSPSGVAVDSAGNLYVVDPGNYTIRKITPAGGVTTLAGTAGMSGSADGTGAAARFNSPSSVAVDSAGNVYVADSGNYTIRKVTSAGVVTTLACSAGPVDPGACVQFPTRVTVDSAGNLYVADRSSSRISKITPTGITTTFAIAGVAGRIEGLAIVGDSIVFSGDNAILLLRHGAQ